MGDQFDKIGEKDASAFRALFATFFPKIQAMLIRQGADANTAEEIAQDTMFAVWRKTHQFSNDKGSVSAWIYAIARNLRIDRVRKNAVWQRLYAELETIEWLGGEAVQAQQWVGERNDVEIALRGLPPEQLEVIQLSFIDGLSQSEIAGRLKLPLGTVKSRMRLAFDKLRSSVGREA
jgi:RNA polymerase sigma-70 factor (ECF subfamily)